jgi:hypothetical protein
LFRSSPFRKGEKEEEEEEEEETAGSGRRRYQENSRCEYSEIRGKILVLHMS